jgi:DNA-binding transcriptional LysR family regulator
MIGAISDIDVRLLKVFMTVVRYRGFAAAQNVLDVSQANISMQMKHLEVRLGFKLCHRGRSGFWLTEEGKAVYEACQALFRSIDEFRSSVASAAGRVAGRLHVSVIDNSIFNPTFRLHQALREFKENEGRDVEVVLYVVAPNDVEQRVFDGSCDLGLGFFPSRRQGLDFEPLFTSHMNLYCGRGHPLYDKAPEGLTLEEVLAAEHAARGYVSPSQLPEFERRFLVGASASTVEGLATFVLSGKYTAYLPDHYARNWTVHDDMRPILPERIGYRSLYEMVTRKGQRSKLLDAFTRQLVAVRGELAQEPFGIGTSI